MYSFGDFIGDEPGVGGGRQKMARYFRREMIPMMITIT
jgi:hypothetical protein